MCQYFQSFRHSGQAKNILEVVQRFVQPGLTHLKADCPVAVHIKHPKHLVNEDLCLVSGHQVHAHDALLVQRPARTGFDKPAETLSLWNVLSIEGEVDLNHSLTSLSSYLVFLTRNWTSFSLSFVWAGSLFLLNRPKRWPDHLIFDLKFIISYIEYYQLALHSSLEFYLVPLWGNRVSNNTNTSYGGELEAYLIRLNGVNFSDFNLINPIYKY